MSTSISTEIVSVFTMRLASLILLLLAANPSFAVNKVIEGGPGTDTLNINLSINLEDFVSLIYDGGTSTDGTFTMVPTSGSSIAFTAIETLTVNGVS